MQQRGFRLTAAWAILLAATVAAQGADPAATISAEPQTFKVSETYNHSPFQYEMKLLAQHDGFRVYRLSYPSPVATPDQRNNTIWADYYLPDNIKPNGTKRPAVITLHILNGDMRVTDVACSVLAKRGMPAIMPTLPYYGDRAKPEGWEALLREPKLFLTMLQQSIEDLRRTADLLASRPEVDPQRIDISGVSLGGIVAASAAAAEPRFYRTSLFLAGGELMTILRSARYTRGLSDRFSQLPADERAKLEGEVQKVDPLTLAPALRERAQQGRVLMVNAVDDEIIPNDCTKKLAASLGISDQVVWLYGHKHDTFISALPESLQKITDFLVQDLPPDASPNHAESNGAATPMQRASALIHDTLTILETEPDAGRYHLVDLEIATNPKEAKGEKTHVRFVRGPSERFALKCRLPVVGDVTVGQREFPWMVTAGKSVLLGVKNPVKDRNPLGLADPKNLAKLRVVGGLIGTLDLVPEALGQWVVVEKHPSTDGMPAVRIAAKEKFPGSVIVSFRKDGKTPSAAAFDVAHVTGDVVIRDWRVNAAGDDSAFSPPSDLPVVEVDQADLYRMFATAFDMAMQRMK